MEELKLLQGCVSRSGIRKGQEEVQFIAVRVGETKKRQVKTP